MFHHMTHYQSTFISKRFSSKSGISIRKFNNLKFTPFGTFFFHPSFLRFGIFQFKKICRPKKCQNCFVFLDLDLVFFAAIASFSFFYYFPNFIQPFMVLSASGIN